MTPRSALVRRYVVGSFTLALGLGLAGVAQAAPDDQPPQLAQQAAADQGNGPGSDPAAPPDPSAPNAGTGEGDPAARNAEPAAPPLTPVPAPSTAKLTPPAPSAATVMSLPSPPAGGAVLHYKFASTWNPSDNRGYPQAGVVMTLEDSTSMPATPITDAWGTCTSNADGDCIFIIPASALGDPVTHHLFRPSTITPPPGYWGPAMNLTGHNYWAWSVRIDAPGTYTTSYDGGRPIPLVANNPTLSSSCSLNVALVFDASYSMIGRESAMIAAADSLVDALAGSDTNFTVYSFDTFSPAGGTNPPNWTTPTSVLTPAGVDAVKGAYAGIAATGGTSYEAAFKAIVDAANPLDLIIFMTDGLPTTHAQAVRLANTLKAQGTSILAIGVGSAMSSPDAKAILSYISGPTQGTDFEALDNFGQVEQRITQLARQNCSTKVTVINHVLPDAQPNPDLTTGVPTGGWDFTVKFHASGAQQTATTDATGSASWPVAVASRSSTATVTITPAVKSGYVLHELATGRIYANCQDAAGNAMAVTNPTGQAAGFTVDVPGNSELTCQVYHEPLPADAIEPSEQAIQPSLPTLPVLPVTGANVATGAMGAMGGGMVLLGLGILIWTYSSRRSLRALHKA